MTTTVALIAIGSNLGNRLANMRAGVAGLIDADGVDLVAVSSLYETAPVGGPDNQGPYSVLVMPGREDGDAASDSVEGLPAVGPMEPHERTQLVAAVVPIRAPSR